MVGPGSKWNGPLGLADSKYASPNRRREVEALLAANPELQEKKNAESILVTREQTKVAEQVECKPDDVLQLAQAQKEAVEQEVARHTEEVERAVYNAHLVTRQVLDMIRNVIIKECPDTADASLRTVDGLWTELETLCDIAQKTKDVVPWFMEKGREHTNLVVTAKVQETHNDYQQELKRNNKRTELLQEQNLGQLQAFKDVEAANTRKNAEQQDHLTRTLLDLGLLKEELSLTKAQLATAKSDEHDAVKLVEKLQKDTDMLVQSETRLATDSDRLRRALKDAEIKLKFSEEEAHGKFGNKIQELTEKLEEEQQKAAAVSKDIKFLRQARDTAKQELEKIKAEYSLLSDKYKNQSGAFGKLADDLKDQTKKAKDLQNEVLKLELQKEEVSKQRDRANWLKETLQKQHAALKVDHEAELDKVRKKAYDMLQELSEQVNLNKAKYDAIKQVHDDLKIVNKDILAKLAKHDSISAANEKAHAEIATLRAAIQNLETATPATNTSAGAAGQGTELQIVQNELKTVKAEQARWQSLATKAMNEYRNVLAKNKEFHTIEEKLVAAQTENEQLKAKGVPPPAAAADPDAQDVTYWRGKYQTLLEDTMG